MDSQQSEPSPSLESQPAEGTICRLNNEFFWLVIDGKVSMLPQDDNNITTNNLFGTQFNQHDISQTPAQNGWTLGPDILHNSAIVYRNGFNDYYLIAFPKMKRCINNFGSNRYQFSGQQASGVYGIVLDQIPDGPDING